MARSLQTTDQADRKTDRRKERGDGDDRRVRKLEDVLWFLIAALDILIFVRFILLLFGARTGVPFVDFWYGLTAPLIAPFAGMFGNIDTYNVYTGQRIEIEALVAIVIYSLIGYLLVLAVRLLRREPRSE
jgi:hypothetical protein